MRSSFGMCQKIWILASPTLPSLTLFFSSIPDVVRSEISPSSSEMIFTALIGRRMAPLPFVDGVSKVIVALFPIYFSPFQTEIRIVERRFAFEILDTAVMVPVRDIHSTSILTIPPGVRLLARSESTSIITCGSFPENSAIILPAFTVCPTFASTLVTAPSTGAAILSFA